jgi:hypothetical protein
MAHESEHAVFNEHMSRWQAHLDRYQATGDPNLVLDQGVLAEVRQLPGYATGSASWNDAQHVCAWFHWLRSEALDNGRGKADRRAAGLPSRSSGTSIGSGRLTCLSLSSNSLTQSSSNSLPTLWPKWLRRPAAVIQNGGDSRSS